MLDVAALYAALDHQRQARSLLWRAVAKEAGVSPSTLTRIGHGRKPDADGLARLLLWLGTTDLGPYLTEVPLPRPAPVVRTGRHNKQLVYVQMGSEPSDADPLTAVCMSPEIARLIVHTFNRVVSPVQELTEERSNG